MKRFGVALLTVLAVAAPQAVSAQNTLPQPLGAQEYLDFQNANSAVVAAWGGVMVGPYNGQLTSMPGNPAITIYCVDFAHWAGDQTVNVTNIGGPTPSNGYSGLDNTRLGYDMVGDTQLRYRKAAFLASLFDSYATTTLGSVNGSTVVSGFNVSSQKNAWSGLHAAIWTIMAPPAYTFPADATFSVNATMLNQMAAPWVQWANTMASGDATFGGMNFTEWSVLTDVNAMGQAPSGNSGGKQEYLVRTTTVTPEPETMILLLSGMLLLGFAARRRLEGFEELG
jgi:hypothetical protein